MFLKSKTSNLYLFSLDNINNMKKYFINANMPYTGEKVCVVLRRLAINLLGTNVQRLKLELWPPMNMKL